MPSIQFVQDAHSVAVENQWSSRKSRLQSVDGPEYNPDKNYPKAWFYPELPWGAPPSWDKTTDQGSNLLVWELITFIACIYVAISVPYVTGFEDARFSDGDSTCSFFDLDETWKIARLVLDICADVIFLGDMVVCFHQAKWIISAEGRPHWELEDDLRILRKEYLRGSFMIDLMGQIPWQYVDCIFGDKVSTGLKLLRLLRLLKLLRLYRIRRLFQWLSYRYPRSVFMTTAIELAFALFLLGHWLGCLWFRVGRESSQPGWTVAQGLEDEDRMIVEGQLFYQWISSFYWTITTMTTIGYGDISATTSEERTMAIFVMIVGSAFFAWSTARITAMLMDQSACIVRFQDKMEELQAYMGSNAMPKELQEDVLNFYMLKFPTMQIFNEQEVLEDLPPGLKRRMVWLLYADIVTKEDTLLSALDDDVKEEFCMCFRRVYESGGKDITVEGQESDGLYFVRFGKVEVKIGSLTLMTAEKGDLIGENALLGLSPVRGKRHRTIRSLTVCELCYCSTDNFFRILDTYPSFRSILRRLLNQHLSTLAQAAAARKPLTMKDKYCVDWKKVVGEVNEARGEVLKLTPRRTRRKSITPMDGSGRKLRTTFTLTIKGITMSPPLPGSWSSHRQCFLALSWPGEQGRHPVISFSEPFRYEHQESKTMLRVQHTLAVTVQHYHNNWSDMEPLWLSLHALDAGHHTSHKTTAQLYKGFVQGVTLDEWRRQAPSTTLMASGPVKLLDLVRNRVVEGLCAGWGAALAQLKKLQQQGLKPVLPPDPAEGSSSPEALSTPITPGLRDTVQCTMQPNWGAGGPGGLLEARILVRLTRQVHPDSNWRRVLEMLNQREDPDDLFHQTKLEQEVNRMQEGVKQILRGTKGLRLQREPTERDLLTRAGSEGGGLLAEGSQRAMMSYGGGGSGFGSTRAAEGYGDGGAREEVEKVKGSVEEVKRMVQQLGERMANGEEALRGEMRTMVAQAQQYHQEVLHALRSQPAKSSRSSPPPSALKAGARQPWMREAAEPDGPGGRRVHYNGDVPLRDYNGDVPLRDHNGGEVLPNGDGAVYHGGEGPRYNGDMEISQGGFPVGEQAEQYHRILEEAMRLSDVAGGGRGGGRRGGGGERGRGVGRSPRMGRGRGARTVSVDVDQLGEGGSPGRTVTGRLEYGGEEYEDGEDAARERGWVRVRDRGGVREEIMREDDVWA